ncbi:phenylpyruvate tautomerase PptA (4-oxalocrotonate tautomerase family) [Dysgonomonas sp. PFB1-18]|uniref:tautomerase family protein n=1 Tax=unclassified Dysgonomonas TaxID=2630389 RepID=UPI002473867E|nr:MULTISPECIES: tautomerase family protein [unclassified Dysgonomonas]MDL2302778.1 tautomerase family protein [Dysgonomonas sp. OttesenSCG-928-D17]MDH6310343.1 phenylpyruvate tautomerase PptA (4-oxalocrotonate tautomerase family) [Dysgonomonas sp. PF1-14]MDH6340327.1 phenylpyruvate tautomerase PptA (4-oxalocrotonate tautomerase family) [Dysgonomonas sp. PF1-16]MDH6381893.1 phenylpyruvate tautomerase PptA (4-oxalocrotonate tautomerase family) [Dysgonomonas sp. PFB1-18]MDH6399298.1 phenylpyruva
MPTVKVELREGRSIETLLKLRDAVTDAVVESLQLPDDDRNIRIIEYKPEFFQMKAPCEILIEISLFKGRTKATKKKLYKNIVDGLDTINIEKEKIMIFLNEQPAENWGVRGGLPADEVDLGFKVDV